MKKLLTFFTLLITVFTFSQDIYNSNNVDEFAVYPGCEDDSNSYLECFKNKLNEEVSDKLSKITLDKILNGSGDYFAKLYFIIDENGYFTNVTSQGNETLARISTQTLYRINREQKENSTKIKPALVNGNPVKVYFNISVLYTNK